MFKAVCSAAKPGSTGAAPDFHLFVPVRFDRREPHPAEDCATAQRLYSDATAEMMSWSAWNATAGRHGAATRPAGTEAGAFATEASGEVRHLRIDLTVEDAEDLAAQLRALIAAAKTRAQGRPTSQAAITWPDLQIGADPRPALGFSGPHSAGRPHGRVIRAAIPA